MPGGHGVSYTVNDDSHQDDDQSGLEAMAEAMSNGYPDLQPLDLSTPALFRRILSLPGFDDDPDAATEEMLEKVQMLWYELVSD